MKNKFINLFATKLTIDATQVIAIEAHTDVNGAPIKGCDLYIGSFKYFVDDWKDHVLDQIKNALV